MLGIRTIDEARKIPESNAFACANMIIEDGLIKTRDGFNKLNSTKYGAAINGIYDYKGRTGVHTAIIGSNGNVYSFGYYSIEVPATIQLGVNFTVVVTKFNFFGNRDYSYNGTCNFTENGDGSLGTASVVCIQGKATLTTQKYSGGTSGVDITITGTDSVDSFVFGSDVTSVLAAPWAFSDLALNKPATASSGANPEYANDGSGAGSQWISATQNAGEWWKVDLGSNKSCQSFVTSHHAFFETVTSYKLQYSLNNSTWFDAYTDTTRGWPDSPSPGASTEALFGPFTGRYWRVILVTSTSMFNLSDFKISL